MVFLFIVKFSILLHAVTATSKKVHMQSRIYPGNGATDAQFFYVGHLSNNGQLRCVGSIIHARWALTAAHCIHDLDNPLFTVGTINLFGFDGMSYNIELFVLHNNFGMEVLGMAPYTEGKAIKTYDIGLIRIASDIQFNERVYSIPLARDTSAYYDYQTALMVGWGWSQYGQTFSSLLLYEYVPIMPINECAALAENWYLSDELQLCASNVNQQQACPGDSGGPLVLNGEQIGIESGADHRCQGVKPSVYTKVSTFVPWIQSVLIEYGEYI